MTESTKRPTTLREAVECLSKIDFSSAVLDTKEPVYDLIPWDVLEQAVNSHDALVAALEQADEYIKRPDIDDDAHTLGIVADLITAALEQVK